MDKALIYQNKYNIKYGRPEVNSTWDETCYDNIKYEIKERHEFIREPLAVKDGVFQCKKCNSKKTYSYSKQTRSADEPLSVFVICVSCNHKWREA
jgi:DNA-directed RNA polymerase subunit M/transcription elongation factor TFIIS